MIPSRLANITGRNSLGLDTCYAPARFISSIGESKSEERSKTERYIDKWFAQTVKPESFYERFASTENKRRCFFYSVDLQGRLFQEDVLPKNIATSLKDEKFLDFFFRRLKSVEPKSKEWTVLEESGVQYDYPFVSPCGIELNFVRPADAPIVFHEIRTGEKNYGKKKCLVFAGTLTQSFHADKLAMSSKTGRLYHQLVSDCDERDGKGITPLHASGQVQYGLIKSSVAVTIADAIVEGEGFGNDIICYDSGKRYPIEWLPSYAEAGSYGLPFTEECDE